MQIDPGWEKQIIAYLDRFQWYSPEAVKFERAKGSKILVNANAYTWNMILNRYKAGLDVPAWLVMHIEGEIRLGGAA